MGVSGWVSWYSDIDYIIYDDAESNYDALGYFDSVNTCKDVYRVRAENAEKCHPSVV